MVKTFFYAVNGGYKPFLLFKDSAYTEVARTRAGIFVVSISLRKDEISSETKKSASGEIEATRWLFFVNTKERARDPECLRINPFKMHK